MKNVIALLVLLSMSFLLRAEEVDFFKGIFIQSWETTVAGPHGIKGRKHRFAASPNLFSYKKG